MKYIPSEDLLLPRIAKTLARIAKDNDEGHYAQSYVRDVSALMTALTETTKAVSGVHARCNELRFENLKLKGSCAADSKTFEEVLVLMQNNPVKQVFWTPEEVLMRFAQHYPLSLTYSLAKQLVARMDKIRSDG